MDEEIRATIDLDLPRQRLANIVAHYLLMRREVRAVPATRGRGGAEARPRSSLGIAVGHSNHWSRRSCSELDPICGEMRCGVSRSKRLSHAAFRSARGCGSLIVASLS